MHILSSAGWKMTQCLANELQLFSCKKLVLVERERFNITFDEMKMLLINYKKKFAFLWKSHKSRLLKKLGLSVWNLVWNMSHQSKTAFKSLRNKDYELRILNWHGLSFVNLSSKDCVWRVTSVIFKNNITVFYCNKQRNKLF